MRPITCMAYCARVCVFAWDSSSVWCSILQFCVCVCVVSSSSGCVVSRCRCFHKQQKIAFKFDNGVYCNFFCHVETKFKHVVCVLYKMCAHHRSQQARWTITPTFWAWFNLLVQPCPLLFYFSLLVTCYVHRFNVVFDAVATVVVAVFYYFNKLCAIFSLLALYHSHESRSRVLLVDYLILRIGVWNIVTFWKALKL